MCRSSYFISAGPAITDLLVLVLLAVPCMIGTAVQKLASIYFNS
jgi:hypothetical protein